MKNLLGPFLLVFLQILHHIDGHGRLMDPPARNSMWRFGFPNPVNYNDNELYCGGYTVQWEQNEGKCGLCGDPYHLKEPRPHEAGGLFAKGIITRHYSVGQLIDVEVELTANHYGRFEMYLCPNNNYKKEATQECLHKYPLYVAGTRDASYVIPEDGKKKAIFRYKVQLPPYVTCTQCVIQWTYFTGNQWGDCSNGTEAVGCGRSETFKNCADVAILSNTAGAIPPLFAGIDNSIDFYKSSFKVEPYKAVYPLLVKEQVCVPKGKYRSVPSMSDWCQTNCLRYPSNCPDNVCECPTTCDAIGPLKDKPGADTFCMDKCIVYPPSQCPLDKCKCYIE